MIRLFLGRKESGKTTLAYYMARKVARLAVFDPRGMIRRPGAAIARTAASFSRGMDALAEGEIGEIVYTPSEPLKSVAFPAFALEVKRWIDERPHEPLAVMVDELTFVDALEPNFEWAVKCCQARSTHFFLTCHRPADVPVDVRAIADYWYLFAAHQEHDRDVIRERCSPAAADAVLTLTGSECVCWNDAAGALESYRDPTIWYVELRPLRPQTLPIELDPAPPNY